MPAEKIDSRLVKMVKEMTELVPGQLFRDVAKFHEKHGLKQVDASSYELPDDLQEFRLKFMLEELLEYAEAVGWALHQGDDGLHKFVKLDEKMDAAGALDALVDLTYVALGAAWLHRFPFNEAWDRVQAANMLKVRAKRPEESKRGGTWDVVKPPGWVVPDVESLLFVDCPLCRESDTLPEFPCSRCNGVKKVVRR